MKQELFNRIYQLLCIKSIVTLVVIGVFAYLSVAGKVNSEVAMGVVTTVIAFYFGTQVSKATPEVKKQ
jgi:FtsH-binding integral membrane protein